MLHSKYFQPSLGNASKLVPSQHKILLFAVLLQIISHPKYIKSYISFGIWYLVRVDWFSFERQLIKGYSINLIYSTHAALQWSGL